MIKEILIGTAIGDAFGAGVEFQDRNWIREHVDFSRFVNTKDQIEIFIKKRIKKYRNEI
jgi:ADP-ribosylglycohydrolase